MRTLSHDVLLPHPLDRVWGRLRDLSRPHEYVPGLTGARMDTAQWEGVGASRTVFPRGMAPMQETVVAWSEGVGFSLRLHRDGKPLFPFREAYFDYALAAEGAATRFTATMRYAFTPAWLDALVLRHVVARNVRGVCDGLARHLGQPPAMPQRPPQPPTS